MRRILVLGTLAVCLASCSDRPRMWRESEIQAIAEDFADAAASDGATMVEGDLSTRINELEQRIVDLEQENRDLESRISTLEIYQ